MRSWITSIEKAEKVVKDPSSPIIRKYLINKSNEFWFSKFEIIKPIKKDPNRFTNKVPNGKLGKKELKINDVK